MGSLPNSHVFVAENASEAFNARHKSDQTSQTFRNPDNLANRLPRFNDDKCVLCQGFSIREYVGKVRSVNMRESWPFSESLVDGNQHLLPPLNRPNYRWWACQYYKHSGTTSHAVLCHGAQPENNGSRNMEGIIGREIIISIEPFSNVDLCSFGDLQEQIRKHGTGQLSGLEDNTGESEKGILRMAKNDEKRDVYEHCQNLLRTPFSAASGSKNGTWEFASQSDSVRLGKNGKPDENVHKDNQNRSDQKQGSAILKASVNQRQVQQLTFDLMETECGIFKRVDITEETGKARRAKIVAQFQITAARSMSIQSERNKSKNQNSQGTRSQSLDISNGDATGPKVCPVCKTFTSTTVTTVNAHMDDCLAQTSDAQKKPAQAQKRKSRTQKKRSIADICGTSPPTQNHSDCQENFSFGMDESAANCKLMTTMAPTQANFGNEICQDLRNLNCKRQRATQSDSIIENGEAGNRKVESLQMERKRQRLLGRTSSVSRSEGVKDLTMPSTATHSMETDHGVERHLKHLNIEEDTNVDQSPSMRENSMQNCDLANNQHQQSGTLMDHIHFVITLPKEDRAKEGITCNITQVEESGMLVEENPGRSSPLPITPNATSDVASTHGMRETLPPSNDISHSHYEKSDLLDGKECKHHKAYSTGSSRLQVEGTSKRRYQNLLHYLGENPVHEKVTSPNPRKTGQCSVMNSLEEEHPLVQPGISDQYPGTVRSGDQFFGEAEGKNDSQGNATNNLIDASTSSGIQSFDWEKENSKGLHSLLNRRLIWGAKKVAKRGHLKNIQLDLNKKACDIPRDSKSCFLGSQSMNVGREGDIPYPQAQQNQKPPKSSLKTGAMQKANNYVEAHPSENATGLVKLSIHGKRYDYGNIDLPLNSQGDFVKHNPNTKPRFNQLYRISNCTVINEPQVSQGTKRLQEFNLVESTRPFYDVTSLNQPLQVCSFKCPPQQKSDYWQDYLVCNTNPLNPDKRSSQHLSLFDQNRRDKIHCGSSHVRYAGSSVGTPDTFPKFSMQETVQSEYNWNQRPKSSVLEKTNPEVDITNWKQSTTKSVIRLMGQSFTTRSENVARSTLKDPQQWNTTSEATMCVSSTKQRVTAYMNHCTECNKDQFYHADPRGNALCQNCRRNNQEMSRSETSASHEDKTYNNNAPKMVDKRLLTNYVFHGHPLKDQCYCGQELTSLPFSATIGNMLISPASYLCNTYSNGDKMEYNDSHLTNQGCPLQRQTYSQLLNSCSGKYTLQKPECNGLTYIRTPCSPIYSDVFQSTTCPISILGPLSGSRHSVTCALAHSSSFPTEKQSHLQTPSFYTSIADSATLLTQRKCISSSINFAEREKQIQNLPKTMTRNRHETSHMKEGIIGIVDTDRNYRADSMTRDPVKDTKRLHRKWISEKHEDRVAGSMQKSDPFSRTQYLHKRQRTVHQEIRPSNVAAQHLKSREISQNNMLDVRCSNAISSNKRDEPIKLSGGAKHILKPSLQNGNGKQFLPIHYTLPFVEITAEE